jgi:tRNA dimethylallyltransferase
MLIFMSEAVVSAKLETAGGGGTCAEAARGGRRALEPVKIVAVVGPTAAGKTEAAIRIAEAFGGEIVSADSMQIYRGMDIGTAKPTAEERRRARHHLIDFLDPAEAFSAAEYQKLAAEAISRIAGEGKLPIVAGGTGLYVNSILFDMDFSASPKDEALRGMYADCAERLGRAALHDRLRALDPEAAGRIHPNNAKKVIRALEILESRAGGGAAGEAGRLRPFAEAFSPAPGIKPLTLGLTRDRDDLYARIERRVDALVASGLEDEVRRLRSTGLDDSHISMKGIGYKEMLRCLCGECSLDEAAGLIKRNSRRYAKRQLTWFRRHPGTLWFNMTGGEAAAMPGGPRATRPRRRDKAHVRGEAAT